MSQKLKLYELPPSPNTWKARVALKYKGLPFESVAVNGQDRASLVEATGQPLTPVLMQGDTVVYDSAAILRFLDGNYRDTPRLFSSDYDTMKAIEQWEAWGRTEAVSPVRIMFGQAFAEKKDEAKIKEANEALATLSQKTEERLGENGEKLVGKSMTAADVTCACVMGYGVLAPEKAASPISQFFTKALRLGADRPKTRAWIERVIALNE